MAGPKKKYKRVSDVPSRTVLVPKGQARGGTWVLHTPDNKRHTFYSAKAAQRFVDKYYPNYSLKEAGGTPGGLGNTTPKETSQPALPEAPKTLPHFASEDLPVYIPSEGSTPFERMMNVKIANNRLGNLAYRRALDNLGMNPFKWPERGGLLAGGRNESYWDSDIHKAVREGNDLAAFISSAPFLAYGAAESAPYVLNGGKWLWNAAQPWLRASIKPATTLAENWAPSLVPAALVADLAIPASFATPGLNNTYEGIRNGDLSQTLWGISDMAMSFPILQDVRAANTLVNGRRAYSAGAPSLIDAFSFNPSSRGTAAAFATGMPFVAAANTPSGPLYEVEVDENGEVLYEDDGRTPKFKKRDANGPYAESNFIPKPTGWLENIWNFAKENPMFTGILASSAIGGIRGGWRYGKGRFGRPKAPTRYSVTENGNEVWREWPSGSRPTDQFVYENAVELPEGSLPEGVVRPTEPTYPLRQNYGVTLMEPEVPRPVEFGEDLLPHPGSRPTGGKKKTLGARQAEWDLRNQAYTDQQERLRIHNEELAGRLAEWDAYDALAPLRQEYDNAYNAYKDAYDTYLANYNLALQNYNSYMSAHPEQAPGYNLWRTARDQWGEATGSKQWSDYQKALETYGNRPELFKHPGRWLGKNWYIWAPTVAGTIWSGFNNGFGGSHTYRPYTGGLGIDSMNTNGDYYTIPQVLNVDSLNQVLRDSVPVYNSREDQAPPLADDIDE